MTDVVKLPASDRALIAEADHVLRKIDSLENDMRQFFNEMGWEWPGKEPYAEPLQAK